MFGNLFKPRSHYVFDYKPRYYDERKERFKKLKESNSDEHQVTFDKSNLKSKWVRAKKSTANRSANRRLIIIIAILIGLLAYFFEIHTLF